MSDLRGKLALVTGASKGIGPRIAQAFAREGVDLFVAARSADKLETVCESLRKHGVQATAVSADLTRAADRERLIERCRADRPLDILVNNAGLEEVVDFSAQDPLNIERIVTTNLIAPLMLTRAVLPQMVARGSGRVINLASLAGKTGMPYGSVYAGTKAGLAEWGLSLNGELVDTGVTVSTICPGFVGEAGMFARKGRKPPRTLGQCSPDDVVRAVLRAARRGDPELLVASATARGLMVLKAMSPKTVLRLGRRSGIIPFLASVAADEPGPTS